MKNDPYPTKQTADNKAHRQSLPSWGDLEGYYHPDHLGSSSWITDQDGEAIQHLQYLPFGEQYIDQRTTGWDAMFTFSGKERDAEMGYSYFGARYYDSDLSIWLSVDPLASKYPSLSPYVYCANNPVKLVDPDGREIWITGENESILYTPGMKYEGSDEFTAKAVSALNEGRESSSTGKSMVDDLAGSEYTYSIKHGETSTFDPSNGTTTMKYGSDEKKYKGGGDITWNPNGELTPVQEASGSITASLQRNGTIDLFHELAHGLDAHNGILRMDKKDCQGLSPAEWSACITENVMRGEMKLPLRTQHGRNSASNKGSGPDLLYYDGQKNVKAKTKAPCQ